MEHDIKYSNFANIAVSTFDIQMKFGIKSPDSATPESAPDTIVSEIIMSPQHAKVFANVLLENIRNYEKIYGQINLEANEEAVKEVQRNGQA